MYKTYNRGTAIYLKAELRNVEKELTDPHTIVISIQDSSGVVKVSEAEMTKIGTNVGKYYYIWQSDLTDDIGQYTVTIQTLQDTYISIYKNVALELE